MKKKHQASSIGLIYTLISLSVLLPYSPFFFFPFLASLPALIFLDFSLSLIVEPGFIHNLLLVILLFSIFIVITITFINKLRMQIVDSSKVRNRTIHFFFILQFFIFHPLGFAIYNLLETDNSSDPQFILEVISTFPYSGIFFLIFGIVLDFLPQNSKS
jgi:hypothetical protein